MRFLKVEVFSILVDRVCKVKYDSLKLCSKMFRHFVGGSSYLRILNASTISGSRHVLSRYAILLLRNSSTNYIIPQCLCVFVEFGFNFSCDQFYSYRSSQFLRSKLFFEVKNVIRIDLLEEMCHCS